MKVVKDTFSHPHKKSQNFCIHFIISFVFYGYCFLPKNVHGQYDLIRIFCVNALENVKNGLNEV